MPTRQGTGEQSCPPPAPAKWAVACLVLEDSRSQLTGPEADTGPKGSQFIAWLEICDLVTWHKIRSTTNQMPLLKMWDLRNPKTEPLEGQLELCALREELSLRGLGSGGQTAAILGSARWLREAD